MEILNFTSNINNVERHLDYLGYNFDNESDESNLLCHKEYSPPLFISFDRSNEIWFFARYNLNNYSLNNLNALLLFINNLNQQAQVASFSYDPKDHKLCFHAVYLGNYKKNNFKKYISYWEGDVIDLINKNSQTTDFLGPDRELAV